MTKLKDFVIKDFRGLKFFIDGIAFTNGNSKSIGVKKLYDLNINESISKSYYENESYYIYTLENKLYKINEEGKTLISENFTTPPDSKTFMLDNEVAVIFGTASMGIIVKDNLVTSLDEGVYSLPENHNGILFTANNNTIYYSESYNQLNFSSSRHKGGQIIIDKTFGKIIKLISFNSNLYIFCEKAILKLNASGDSEKNTIIKVMEFQEKIEELSVEKVMNKIIFYINGKLFFMENNEKITDIDITNEKVSLEKTSNYAGVSGNNYLTEFSLKNSQDKYLFIYNSLENYSCFLNIGNNMFLGNIIANSNLSMIGTIDESTKIFEEEKEYLLTIKDYNFNSIKTKAIKGVVIYGEFFSSTLSVKGEYMTTSIKIQANTNTYFYCVGKIFDIDIKINKPLKIEKIVFIMEEKDYDI